MKVKPFMMAIVLFWAALNACGEQITREDIIETVIANMRFVPVYGESIGIEQQTSVKKELIEYIRTASFIPPVMKGLPDGTRDSVLRRSLDLVSADREYCMAEVKAHLMAQVVGAEIARDVPMLNEQQQGHLLAAVDSLLATVGDSCQRHMGSFLTEEDIRNAKGSIREFVIAKMRSPVSAWYKRVPSEARMRAIAADFDARLAEAQSRVSEEAARMIPTKGAVDYEDKLARFRAGLVTQIVEPLRAVLNREMAIDEAPFRSKAEKMFPGYWDIQYRANELWEREMRKAADRCHKRFQDAVMAGNEQAALRMKGDVDPAALPNGNIPDGQRTGLLERPEPREATLELPSTSRPATRPATKPSG